MTDERELLVCRPFLLFVLAGTLVSAPPVAFRLDFVSDRSTLLFSGRSGFLLGLFSNSCFGFNGLLVTGRSDFSDLCGFSEEGISFLIGFSGVESVLSCFSTTFSAMHKTDQLAKFILRIQRRKTYL